MKIAQVTSFFMPKKYGSNELFLCRELVKRGHKLTVFTAETPRREYSMLEESSANESSETYEGFNIQRFPSNLRIKDIQIMPSLFKALAKQDFDIIHAHEFFSPPSFYSSLVGTMRHTPLIITQHNDQFPVSTVSRYFYYIDACTVGFFSLKRARKIIALTRAIQNHLFLFGVPQNKIHIIPNAVDTQKFVPNSKNLLIEKWNLHSPIILYVGRFSEVKGIRYLMKAFPAVLQSIPDVKLVLIGGGPLEGELKVYERKFSGHIFCMPFVPNDVMPYIYSGCDVVVLPSLEERFGNVTLEAMACGKPVVGSCVGGMLDTISHEETGILVQPGDADQISASLIRILKDDNLRGELGKNSRARVLRKYSSDFVIKLVEKLYFSVFS